jgi:tRNA-dihydrouridine synthase
VPQANPFSGNGAIHAMPAREAYEKDFVGLFYKLHAAFSRPRPEVGLGFGAEADQKITVMQIKKFASWYSSGYPGASQFRKAIFQTKSVDETMRLTLEFFGGLRASMQTDTSKEDFLMGGHG